MKSKASFSHVVITGKMLTTDVKYLLKYLTYQVQIWIFKSSPQDANSQQFLNKSKIERLKLDKSQKIFSIFK